MFHESLIVSVISGAVVLALGYYFSERAKRNEFRRTEHYKQRIEKYSALTASLARFRRIAVEYNRILGQYEKGLSETDPKYRELFSVITLMAGSLKILHFANRDQAMEQVLRNLADPKQPAGWEALGLAVAAIAAEQRDVESRIRESLAFLRLSGAPQSILKVLDSLSFELDSFEGKRLESFDRAVSDLTNAMAEDLRTLE